MAQQLQTVTRGQRFYRMTRGQVGPSPVSPRVPEVDRSVVWMAVDHVILKESYVDRQVPYFQEYIIRNVHNQIDGTKPASLQTFFHEIGRGRPVNAFN